MSTKRSSGFTRWRTTTKDTDTSKGLDDWTAGQKNWWSRTTFLEGWALNIRTWNPPRDDSLPTPASNPDLSSLEHQEFKCFNSRIVSKDWCWCWKLKATHLYVNKHLRKKRLKLQDQQGSWEEKRRSTPEQAKVLNIQELDSILRIINNDRVQMWCKMMNWFYDAIRRT